MPPLYLPSYRASPSKAEGDSDEYVLSEQWAARAVKVERRGFADVVGEAGGQHRVRSGIEKWAAQGIQNQAIRGLQNRPVFDAGYIHAAARVAARVAPYAAPTSPVATIAVDASFSRRQSDEGRPTCEQFAVRKEASSYREASYGRDLRERTHDTKL